MPFTIKIHHPKIPGIKFIASLKNIPMNTETLQAVGGLLLTGTGLSMAIDAGTVRAKKGKWFVYGTIALIIFQAGLCLVVGSVSSHQK